MATRSACLAQALRGDRRIVEEAEAAGDVGEGVMARRTAERVGGRRACLHGFGRRDRGPGAPAGAVIGLGRDRAGRVGHVVAGLADRRRRIGAAARDRMDVRDHLGRRAFDALPALEDVLQELDIFRRVDGGDRAETVAPRPLDRAAGRLRAGKQPLDALRHFRIGLRRTGGQEGFRIVAALLVGEKGFHAYPPSLRGRHPPARRNPRHRRHGSARRPNA